MLNEKGSIRMCSDNIAVSKSKIHSYIHTYIKRYYDEEYKQIVRILKYNKRYRTKPRRLWRGAPW